MSNVTAKAFVPQIISDIESKFNIELTEEIYSDLPAEAANTEDELAVRNFFYKVNSDGVIVSISIPETDVTDLTFLTSLKELQYLDLTNNKIADLGSIADLVNLKCLYLGGNQIKDITPLKSLKELNILTLWDNPINDMSTLANNVKLKKIYCQNTLITTLDFANNLEYINEIAANGCKIEDVVTLSKFVKNKNLGIDLSNNKIVNVSKDVADKVSLTDMTFLSEDDIESDKILMSVFGNPLQFPPLSVIELGPEAMDNYYEAAETYGSAPLSEGRIIVIGDGSSGKSSLIDRLLYDTFEPGKSQTNGIRIEHWNLELKNNRKLLLHFWDFGGQEIQHAVHKFFFTAGCLYILVLDNRKEEEPEYWLQQVESLGGSAPVLVVFNKYDENSIEVADRKFLKEKYPNIVGFYHTSCKTDYGIGLFKKDLENQVIKLSTVEEQFPNNWFNIKKNIEKLTGSNHYLDFDKYSDLCKSNNVTTLDTQKLLLKYFTTIGAVTWFGDTYLNFLHVLSPAWITQGVYKIITSRRTADLYGRIEISDFKDLLYPSNTRDFIYDEKHYGYILSMMKKFDLCYTPDDNALLIPSAFGKVPKVEYSEFRGESVRTYILQFKDYMPLALIHRFTAKKVPNAYENNFWYSGIVIKDSKSDTLAMVQADKEARRIYVRIKGETALGLWEHIRREFDEISSNYAKIVYDELVALDETSDFTVSYEDLVSHIQSNKAIYFHAKQRKDYNVGYLIGLFESKENTLEKFKSGIIKLDESEMPNKSQVPRFAINILNHNSPNVHTRISNDVNVNIDVKVINEISSELKGNVSYLLDEIKDTNNTLGEALQKLIAFSEDAKAAKNTSEIKEKGWSRKLKNIMEVLGKAGSQLKDIKDGGEVLKSLFGGIKHLAGQFNLHDITKLFENL